MAIGNRVFRLLAVALLLVAFAGCSGRESGQDVAVFGRAPITPVIHQQLSDALADWCRKGYRKKVLVHISGRDAFEPLPAAAIDRVTELYKERKPAELLTARDAGGGSLAAMGNFIYAAQKSGAVKEVYWVIPYKFAISAGGGEEIRNFLRTLPSVADKRAIDKMVLRDGCLEGALNGIQLHVCPAAALPRIKEPVLVSMSMDFLRDFAAEEQVSSLLGFKMFYDMMTGKQLKVLSFNLSSGIEDGRGLPVHGHMLDQLREVLLNPELAAPESAPKLWLLRDDAENKLNGGEKGLVRETAKEALQEFKNDPPLLMIDMVAQTIMGDSRGAFARAGALCEEQAVKSKDQPPAGCQLMVQLGDIATDGAPATADRFYEAYLRRYPQSLYGLRHHAESLIRRQKPAEAQAVLARLAKLNASATVSLLQGEVESRLGSPLTALSFYDQVLKRARDGATIPITKEHVAALNQMASAYADAGREKEAASVRELLKKMEPGLQKK